MEKDDEALWEDVKIAMLRDIVDGAAGKLSRGDLSDNEIKLLLKSTRRKVLTLFPSKENVYDLIYVPRFNRIIEETYGNGP